MATVQFVTISHPERGTAQVHPASAYIYQAQGWTVVEGGDTPAAAAQPEPASEDEEEPPPAAAAPAKKTASRGRASR